MVLSVGANIIHPRLVKCKYLKVSVRLSVTSNLCSVGQSLKYVAMNMDVKCNLSLFSPKSENRNTTSFHIITFTTAQRKMLASCFQCREI